MALEALRLSARAPDGSDEVICPAQELHDLGLKTQASGSRVQAFLLFLGFKV